MFTWIFILRVLKIKSNIFEITTCISQLVAATFFSIRLSVYQYTEDSYYSFGNLWLVTIPLDLISNQRYVDYGGIVA